MHTAITAVIFSVIVGGAFVGVSQAVRSDSAPPTPVLDAVADDFADLTSDLDGNLGKAKSGLRGFLDALPPAVGLGDPYAGDWDGEFPPAEAAPPAAATAAADIPPGHLPLDERPSDNAPDAHAPDATEDEDDPAGHLEKDDRKAGRGD